MDRLTQLLCCLSVDIYYNKIVTNIESHCGERWLDWDRALGYNWAIEYRGIFPTVNCHVDQYRASK